MNIVKCRKCGATVMSSDTLLSNMQEEYNQLSKRQQKAKGAEKTSLIQQMAHITKIMTQTLHNIAELEIRKYGAYYELYILRRYLIDNHLLDYDVLDKIRDEARAKAKEKIAESEKALDNLYGDFKNICSNNTKSDPTAREAIKRT
jgi:hypothetical protein